MVEIHRDREAELEAEICGLIAKVDEAAAVINKLDDKHSKLKERAKNVRNARNIFWKEKIQDLREEWKLAAKGQFGTPYVPYFVTWTFSYPFWATVKKHRNPVLEENPFLNHRKTSTRRGSDQYVLDLR